MSDKSSQPERSFTIGRPHPAIPFSLGAVAVGLLWFASHSMTSNVKNVTVTYMYETSPGSASGGKVYADSITFYPGYVVMSHGNGHGNVFSVDRLRDFSYSPGK
jgi:hypothetical protein